jgi:hypothetical protein
MAENSILTYGKKENGKNLQFRGIAFGMAASLLNCIMKHVSGKSYKSSGVFWLTKALKILCLPRHAIKMTENCSIY